MQIETSEHWFVLIFSRALTVGLLAKSADHGFAVDDVVFAPVEENFLSAFVDRLLDADGKLVGLNVSPTSDAAEWLVRTLRSAPYTTSGTDGLQIWFSESPIHDARNSAEQAFGGQVFRGSSGDLALSIDALSLLTDTDLDRLRQEPTMWVTLRP